MIRPTLVAATMALLVGSGAWADDTKPELVPDPDWVARPGDKATLYDDGDGRVFIARDMFAFQDLVKGLKAKDTDGLRELMDKGKVAFEVSGTPILVIERHENQFIAGGVLALEVRLLDGANKGRVCWIYRASAARLIEKKPDPAIEKSRQVQAEAAARREAKEAEKARANAPAARAASLLNIARNLEKSGKPKPALENYRKIVKEFGDTPSAKEAAGRVRALEGK